MSTNIQYRLHQFETVPPADSWNRISDRLDQEFNTEDIILSQKLSEFSQTPPAASFFNVMAALDAVSLEAVSLDTAAFDAVESPEEYNTAISEPSRGAKVIPMRLRRVAVAAVVCVAISLLYLYMNPDNRNLDLSGLSESATQRADMISPVPSSPATVLPAPPLTGTMPATIASIGTTNIRSSLRKKNKNHSSAIQASYEPENDNNNLSYAAISTKERPNADENIVIPTEPIRDQQGNIIMDEKLISAPDVNYVTVTGPNGAQTKISKKFLHALGYMNARSGTNDFAGITLHDGSLWKWLFQEWRQKLLAQPSFIPSATNFLDIIELKEILHENL
jgi:hypothetical protein